MTNLVRVAVVGTGIGVTHIEVLREVPGAEVVAVCSAQLERARAVAERFGIPRATADYRDLLGPDVDALVVATPPALHAPIGLEALAAGKHLFCEKPLAANLHEARALRDAAHAAGVIHVVNYQLRFAPPFARAHELIGDGYLGRLMIADARVSINPVDYLHAPWASGSKVDWFTDATQSGGLLGGSAGPHLVDLLLWYGGPVEAVAAQTAVTHRAVSLADGREARDISAADAFLGLVRFAGGALATVRGVPLAYHGGGFSLELHGTAGALAVEGGTLHGATTSDDALTPLDLPAGAPQDRVVIASRFVEAIRSGGPSPAPTFDDGLAAQALIDAVLEAARTGQWIGVGR
jgi:predicted dehydrogenase